MAGPVWRVRDGEVAVCERCLREMTRGYAEGTVSDGEFYPDRLLCEQCYEERVRVSTERA